jgi:hypothetical protein
VVVKLRTGSSADSALINGNVEHQGCQTQTVATRDDELRMRCWFNWFNHSRLLCASVTIQSRIFFLSVLNSWSQKLLGQSLLQIIPFCATMEPRAIALKRWRELAQHNNLLSLVFTDVHESQLRNVME